MKLYEISDRMYAVTFEEEEQVALDLCAELEGVSRKELLTAAADNWLRYRSELAIRTVMAKIAETIPNNQTPESV